MRILGEEGQILGVGEQIPEEEVQILEEAGQSHLEEEVSPDWRKSGNRKKTQVRFPPFHLQVTKMNVIDSKESLTLGLGAKNCPGGGGC